MTKLRAQLQKIWNDPVVRCPAHQVWWHDGYRELPDGTVKKHGEGEAEGLYWSKGKKHAQPERKKIEWPK